MTRSLLFGMTIVELRIDELQSLTKLQNVLNIANLTSLPSLPILGLFIFNFLHSPLYQCSYQPSEVFTTATSRALLPRNTSVVPTVRGE